MIGQLAWRGFSFAFGMLNLTLLTAVAGLRDGSFGKRGKLSEEERRELELGMFYYYSFQSSQSFYLCCLSSVLLDCEKERPNKCGVT